MFWLLIILALPVFSYWFRLSMGLFFKKIIFTLNRVPLICKHWICPAI